MALIRTTTLSPKIEEVSGITNAVDLTNVEPVERLVQLNQTLICLNLL
jgi:hypothetical protein